MVAGGGSGTEGFDVVLRVPGGRLLADMGLSASAACKISLILMFFPLKTHATAGHKGPP